MAGFREEGASYKGRKAGVAALESDPRWEVKEPKSEGMGTARKPDPEGGGTESEGQAMKPPPRGWRWLNRWGLVSQAVKLAQSTGQVGLVTASPR